MRVFITTNETETIALAKRLTKVLPRALNTIILEGDISYGKTTFTKGIGQALNIQRVINSPTFTILKEYQGDLKLNHFDFYRLHQVGSDFDLEEYINDPEALNVIEWPRQVADFIPSRYVGVKFIYLDQNRRQIEISTHQFDDSWEKNI